MLEHSNLGFNGIPNEANQRAAFCSAVLERPFLGGLGPGRGRGEWGVGGGLGGGLNHADCELQ
jgi:hypothetical protein